jgi:hypothetical protein
MTTPRELAEELVAALNTASVRCTESLSIMKQHESLGELNVYARLVGLFLGHSYTNILAPLWQQFPELEPEQMKTEYVERQPVLSPESREAISAFLLAAGPALQLAKQYAAVTPELPFGGFPEVAKSVEEIESFLASPRFRDAPPNEA